MANSIITATNVYNDANTFQDDFGKALAGQQNWRQVITDLANLIDDSIALVGGNSALASTAGLAATLNTAKDSCTAITNQFNAGGLSAVNAQKLFTCASSVSNATSAIGKVVGLPVLSGVSSVIGAASGVAATMVSPTTTLGNIGNDIKVYLNNSVAGELQFSDITGSLQATVIPASGNNTSPTVNISGQSNNPFDINNANINISSKSSVQVYGVGDDFNINSGSAVLLNGTSNIVNANNGQITLGAGSSAIVTGSGNTISVGVGASLTVNSGTGSNAINEASHYTNQNPANDWHWLSDMLINTVAA